MLIRANEQIDYKLKDLTYVLIIPGNGIIRSLICITWLILKVIIIQWIYLYDSIKRKVLNESVYIQTVLRTYLT